MKLSGLMGIGILILIMYFIFGNQQQKEAKNIELEQSYINQRIEDNRTKLTFCLDEVDQRVRNDILKWCQSFAQAKSLAPNVKFIDIMPGCSIPQESMNGLTEGWKKDKQEGKDECYRLYPQ